MVIASTKCCAVFEIHQLSSYKSAEEALSAFCAQAIPAPPKFHDGTHGSVGELSSFYFFTSAVSHDGQRAAGIFSNGNRLYAKEFMELIRREQLGEVWESPTRVNKAFHAQNSNQIYVWMPDNTRLKAWWAKKQAPQQKGLDLTLKV